MINNSHSNRPIVFEASDKVVAINPSTGDVLEITDSSRLSQIQGLIKRRSELGIELSKQLKSSGLITAAEDEPTAISA